MPSSLIYVKLGVGVTTFMEQELGVIMDADLMPLAVIDYTNLTPRIHQALDAGTIVQISENEYYTILSGFTPEVPIEVNTNNLLTLTRYWEGCPPDNCAFFFVIGGVFYKTAWSTMKSCAASGAVNLLFRVGDINFPVPYPQDGDDTFQSDLLKHKDVENIIITVSGVEIHHFDDNPNVDYFNYNSNLGTIQRPALYKSGEIVRIKA